MFNGLARFFRASYLPMFFLPAGVILIVFGIFTFNSVEHTKNFIRTEAVVSKTELFESGYTDADGNYQPATYTVYVKYTVDGTEYESEYGVFTGYYPGDSVKICYDPNDPSSAYQPNGIILPIALFSGGILFLIGGAISAVREIKKYKKLKEQEKEWADGN